MQINKRACNALAKQKPSATVNHWDDDFPGFGIRQSPQGRLSFILKYRVKGDSAQRWITLGTFPTLLPEAAREEATAIKREADLGRDLVATRRADSDREKAEIAAAQALAIPLPTLLDAWRAHTESAIAAKLQRGESVLYERELLRLETNIVRPALKDESAGELDPRRFQAIVNRQAETSVSTARNVRSLLVRFTRLSNDRFTMDKVAIEWPTTFVLKLKGRVRSRAHRFTIDEAAALWIAAGDLGRRGALVRFMLLTACRRIEAQKVAWDHIELDDPIIGANWQQPPHLTKNKLAHRVPLSPPAVALLRWLPPRATKASGEADLVFAGRGNGTVGGWTDIRRALLKGAGVDDGTLHDIRRTVVSALGDHGFDPQVADTLLNHSAATTMGGVMAVYQRSELWQKRRQAIELWAELLMGAVAARLKVPPGEAAWGLKQPFQDAKIIRPKQGAPEAPAQPAPSPPRRRRR